MKRCGSDMKKIKEIWQKWYVQLIIILIPFTLGFIGYWMKYESMSFGKEPIPKDMVLYSTIRLFGLMFDGDKNGTEWYDYMLAAARWLAVIPTGNVLHRLLKPITARFFSELGFFFWNRKKNRLLVFGSTDACRHIADTAGEYSPMIRCETDDQFRQLRKDGYRCVQMTRDDVMNAAIEHTYLSEAKTCRIVINEQDDEINLDLCRIAVREIRNRFEQKVSQTEALKQNKTENEETICRLEKQMIRELDKISIVVYGDKNLESVYLDLVKQSYGILKYTNKYRKTAMDLIEQYPLVRFMDRDKDMIENGLVDESVELNVIMIGFGDTNQELFVSSTIVNQFVTGKQNEIPRMKTVNYYIYDKEPVETNKNLNHMAFRFENEFLGAKKTGMIRENDYLSLPPDPSNNDFYQTDINDQAFYEQLWHIMTRQKRSVNVISIAHGGDLENIDLAQKLKAKVKEWNIGNIHLFVKIRKAENESFLGSDDSERVVVFGNEMEAFDMQGIFNDPLEKMSQRKHCMNAVARCRQKYGTECDEKNVELHSLYEWHIYDPMKKKSSIYSILSMRSKLLMMGLDYRKKGTGRQPLRDNGEYFAVYAKDDMPAVDQPSDTEKGKEIYDYRKPMSKEDFRPHTLRRNLAVQEHYRWNAFMICNGFVPATKESILSGKTRDYALRTHGSLTTFEGLFEYIDLLKKTDIKPEKVSDVISNDFRLMDDAWWYLDMFGYEMIPAESPDEVQ